MFKSRSEASINVTNQIDATFASSLLDLPIGNVKSFKDDVKIIWKLSENYCSKYIAASILSQLTVVATTESILHLF